MMRFVLMVNKQGQTRLAQYYEFNQMEERCALEAEVIRKCLARTETQVPTCRRARTPAHLSVLGLPTAAHARVHERPPSPYRALDPATLRSECATVRAIGAVLVF